MHLHKKILALTIVSIILATILSFHVFARPILSTNDYYLRGDIRTDVNGDTSAFGSITQFGIDSTTGLYREATTYCYPNDDYVELLTDRYGCYGFRWNGWNSHNLTGLKEGGNYKLNLIVPWTTFDGLTYLGSADKSYYIYDLKLQFFCCLYYTQNGQLRKFWTESQPYATLSDNDSFIGETTSFTDNEIGNFTLTATQGTITRSQQNLELELTWTGKPSLSNNPYIEFRYIRSVSQSYMKVTPLSDFLAQAQDDIWSKLDGLTSRLEIPKPEFSWELDITTLAYLKRFLQYDDWTVMQLGTSLCFVSLTLGSIVYLLHGKRRN